MFMDPTYAPLITLEDDVDHVPQRSKCRKVVIYSAVTAALIMCLAGAVYFLYPRCHSCSSATVTIVNRYSDDISVYQMSREGDEKIVAHLGPNEKLRIPQDHDQKCFVRHQEEYIAVEQINIKGDIFVVGEGPDVVVPSRSGGEQQVVTFINDEPESVVVSWIDFNGVAVKMTTLKPQCQYEAKTFTDHVFTISTANEHHLIGQFTIRPNMGVIRTQPIVESKDYPIHITVENRTSGPIKVMWCDGERDNVIGELEPNTQAVMDSFDGHKLYIVDSDGDQSGLIKVKPSVTALRAVPRSKSKIQLKRTA